MGKPQDKKKSRSEREAAVPEGGVDVFGSLLETVSAGIAEARRAGPDFLDAVSEVLLDAMRSAAKARSDLTQAAKAIVVGVLRGLGEREDAALLTLSRTARAVLREAAGLEADLAACTKGLILGAIASAKDLGVDRAKAASAAAEGAMEGARGAGATAVDRVLEALKEPIGGVKVALAVPPNG